MDNLILKITECQKHGIAIFLEEHKDLVILTNATGEAGKTVLLHDYDWFDNGDIINPGLHRVILSRTGKTSNIFTFNPDKAFAKSRNVHMLKWNFLLKIAGEPDPLKIPLTNGDAEITFASNGILLPPG